MSSRDLRVAFGKRVRELRLDLGLSHEKLVERAGLHRNYIGGVERGERNIGLLNVDRLAAALNSRLSDLFSDL